MPKRKRLAKETECVKKAKWTMFDGNEEEDGKNGNVCRKW